MKTWKCWIYFHKSFFSVFSVFTLRVTYLTFIIIHICIYYRYTIVYTSLYNIIVYRFSRVYVGIPVMYYFYYYFIYWMEYWLKKRMILFTCRPLLKQIKNSAESHVVLDCSTEKIYDVLKQAQQIGMMSDYHSYLITSLVSFPAIYWLSTIK